MPPLQNRVDPFGNFIQTEARGQWLGNRGQLHGTGKIILRPFRHKAWIICELQFKNRHREIMAPNLWTELFFLDEATALSAGHRPCFECRRAAATEFKRAWIKGNPSYGFDLRTRIGKFDEVIHDERIDSQGGKITWFSKLNELPDGTFIAVDRQAYLLINSQLKLWTPYGYLDSDLPKPSKVEVLTPKSIVNALKHGYKLQSS